MCTGKGGILSPLTDLLFGKIETPKLATPPKPLPIIDKSGDRKVQQEEIRQGVLARMSANDTALNPTGGTGVLGAAPVGKKTLLGGAS